MQKQEIKNLLTSLEIMNLKELQIFWNEQFNERLPNLSERSLRNQIVFMIQEKFYGGHSDFIRQQVNSIGFSKPKVYNSKGFEVGKVFTRVWKDVMYRIVATEKGFIMNKKHYRSLSGAAFDITGTQWSGKTFWGVK